jgi:hypothetical protein
MSDADLNQLLQSDPRVGAAFAAAKYIKAHRAKK